MSKPYKRSTVLLVWVGVVVLGMLSTCFLGFIGFRFLMALYG